MKIGIISDTHGCLETWQKVFNQYFTDADVIIHAGDVLYHGRVILFLPNITPSNWLKY